MNQHPFDTLTLNNGASFIFTPCPGTKDVELGRSVQQLKTAGANAIITLMYDAEMQKNDVQSLPAVCQSQGLQWFQLPIYDDQAPNDDFAAALNKQIAGIVSILTNKGTIAVHCKGGSGRTGLVIGLLMYHLGYEKADIVKQVQLLRPQSLINCEQRNYFDNFQVTNQN